MVRVALLVHRGISSGAFRLILAHRGCHLHQILLDLLDVAEFLGHLPDQIIVNLSLVLKGVCTVHDVGC